MLDVVAIAGSPSRASRSSATLDYIRLLIEREGLQTAKIAVRDLPADDLLFANAASPAIRDCVERIAQARGVVIATPVYKAAYSGALKAFLDLLPQDALTGKVVLPLATGGSLAHVLAIEYALNPVLSALGADHIVSGVYVQDSQAPQDAEGRVRLEAATDERVRRAVAALTRAVRRLNDERRSPSAPLAPRAVTPITPVETARSLATQPVA